MDPLYFERGTCRYNYILNEEVPMSSAEIELTARAMFLVWQYHFPGVETMFTYEPSPLPYADHPDTAGRYHRYPQEKISVSIPTIYKCYKSLKRTQEGLLFVPATAHESKHHVQHYQGKDRLLNSIPNPDLDYNGYYRHPMEVQARDMDHFILWTIAPGIRHPYVQKPREVFDLRRLIQIDNEYKDLSKEMPMHEIIREAV